MASREHIQKLLEAGRRRGFWGRGIDFQNHAKQIFRGIQLPGKCVLEIGCGRGIFTLWAGIEGAQRVVGLEPIAAGFYDSLDFLTAFRTMAEEVGLTNVEMDGTLIQEYNPSEAGFDLVVSVGSINHLNEDACIRLRKDSDARKSYLEIFRKIRSLMKPGGKFIALDCSDHTLISDMGLKNPFAPYIEWEKHQTPEVWAEVLAEASFSNPQICYISNAFGRHLGVPYLPRFISYCMDSNFRLEVTAV